MASNPFTSIYPPQKRIIAIGDIHGDLDVLKLCLSDLAEVIIDNKGKGNWEDYQWVGKDTHVVLVGDLLDRYRLDRYTMAPQTILEGDKTPGEVDEEEVKIYKFINRLNTQAKKVGGKIIKLIGNHEILNAKEEVHYASPYSLKNPIQHGGTKIDRKIYFTPGQPGAELLLEDGIGAIVKVGDWIFVHGGIAHSLRKSKIFFRDGKVREGITLADFEKVNDTVFRFLKDGKSGLTVEDVTIYENLLSGRSRALLWNRDFGDVNKLHKIHTSKNNTQKYKSYCGQLKEIFQMLCQDEDASCPNNLHLVISHCPQSMMNKATESHSMGSCQITPTREILTPPIIRSKTQTRSDKLPCGIIYGISTDCFESHMGGGGLDKSNNLISKLWRIDVAQSRAFDLNGVQRLKDHIKQLEANQSSASGVSSWEEKKLAANIEKEKKALKKQVDRYLQGRCPQVLEITHSSGKNKVKVLRCTMSHMKSKIKRDWYQNMMKELSLDPEENMVSSESEE